MNLVPVGFWRKHPAASGAPGGEEDLPYPAPAPGATAPVPLPHLLRYLTAHAFLESYEHGAAACRLCGAPNGYATLTDGVHVWPEGLAHYVLAHAVALPEGFVRHIAAAAATAAEAAAAAGAAALPPPAALFPTRNHLLYGEPPTPLPAATLAWLRARTAVLDLGPAA
jgi:hypothetical protein